MHWQWILLLISLTLIGASIRIRGRARWFVAVMAFIAVCLSAFALFALPPRDLPAPSGAFSVGFMQFHLVDESRQEHATENQQDRRELMVYAWYPTSEPNGEPLPYLMPEETVLVSRVYNNDPTWWYSHLTSASSSSYRDAPPVLNQRFPLLIYNHGGGWHAKQHIYLMQELASHGYVVLSIAHPYQSTRVIFPDGRTVDREKSCIPDCLPLSLQEYNRLERQLEQSLLASTYEEYHRLIGEVLTAADVIHLTVDTHVADTATVVNAIAESAPVFSALLPAIDVSRLGVMGWSLGGATAIEYCYQSGNCSAAINMDGRAVDSPGLMGWQLKHPALFMYANYSATETTPRQRNDFLTCQSQAPAYSVTIGGTIHSSFSDYYLFLPIHQRYLGQTMPAVEANMLIADTSRRFLDKYVKEVAGARFEKPAPANGILDWRENRRDGNCL